MKCPKCQKEGELIKSEDGLWLELNCSCTPSGPTVRQSVNVKEDKILSERLKKFATPKKGDE